MSKEASKYAIIADGGRQYRVAPGETFEIDRLGQKVGSKIKLDNVLLVADGGKVSIGKPKIAGAAVECEVLAQIKGEKLIAYMYRCKKGSSRRKKGHRQKHTLVKVTAING